MRTGIFAVVALAALTSSAVELFNGRDLTGWYKYLKDRGRDNDPRSVLSVTNGVIRITGEEWGALVSEKEYSDYRLTVEYRWLGTRFGIKKDWALDSGILFHSVGPDGGFEGIWMASHECNLIQGATGDFWTVHPKGSSMFLEAEVGDRLLMGKYRIWEKGGAKVRLTGNDRICRFDIDPTWTDTPAAPLAVNEHPVGEWNRVVLECRGATVDVWSNGKLVNRATRVEPARGRIQLQSEGCGVEFRRVTLERLDECQRIPHSPPRVVAVPPTFAARDMCALDDGEIRHYGWQSVGGMPCRVYASTRDFGESWTTRIAAENDVGAMVKSPYGGEWLYWQMKDDGRMQLVRSKIGPGDTCPQTTVYPWTKLELRQLLAMKSRRRWVAAFSDVTCASNECYHATVALSDDDGRSWRRVDLKPVAGVERMAQGDKRPHWFNNGCEPSVVELKDGALLLAVRTSGPHAAFYRSEDGGETWSEGTPDPSFWQANTMPYLFRLRDGRLLFIWNNTQMLPTRGASEYPELDAATLRGEWESVFTNRDALHAAISEDDGKTWKGFREVILNPIRNASDFRQLGNDPLQEHDKSVHQTQAIELPDGKVLLSLGQNIAARRLVIIDPEWLYETGREEDFRHGLENLSTHLYVKSLTGGWRGFAGHCAWNRAPGAMLVRDPDTGSETQREVLQLCRISDPRLVSDRQGIVWNFPAARRGRFETECRIDGEGFRFVLTDHWINPCDETNPQMSPVAVDITADRIGGGEWHRLVCEWDEDRGVFTVACGNFRLEGRMTAVPKFGLSYAHLQTLSEFCNPKGAYFRSFSMSAVQDNDDTRRK